MIGRTISHYEILEKLGEGGMGVVYKARDTKLDRIVAIKFLPPHLSSDPEAVKRFVHEAKAASALNHSAIGVIYEIDETEDGQTFIAMALYEGGTLRERIDSGEMTTGEAIAIASQIASGLARAHEKGIVHRDIKPQNILLTRDGEVKIIDFGLAKLTGRTRLTRDGSTLGTAAYMSPEQVRGEEVDHRSDIFSLGTILYEMLAGETPFKGEHEAAMLYGIVHEDPASITERCKDLPAELYDVIEKALKKDKGERYQAASEMKGDLDFVKEESSSSIRSQRKSRKPSSRRWIAAVAGIVIITIIAAFMLKGRFGTEKVHADELALAVIEFRDLTGSENNRLSIGLTSLLNTGLIDNCPIRVVSEEMVSYCRRKLYGESELPVKSHQAINIAKEARAAYSLSGEINEIEGRRFVGWRLIDVQSGDGIGGGTAEWKDILVIADEIKDKTIHALNEITGVDQDQEIKSVTEVTTAVPEAYDEYMAGIESWRLGECEKAVGHLMRAIDSDSTFALAHYALSKVYRLGMSGGGGLYRKYADLAWNYRSRMSLKDRLRLEVWRSYFIHKDISHDEMRSACEQILKQWPDDLDTYREISRYEHFVWNFSAATRNAERGLDYYPDDYELRDSFVEGLLKSGDRERALRESWKNVDLFPDDKGTWNILGKSYLLVAKPDSADWAFNKALEIDPDYYAPLLGLVYSRYYRGEVDRAIDMMEQLLSGDRLDKLTKRRALNVMERQPSLAMLYAEIGRYEDALMATDRAARLAEYTLIATLEWHKFLLLRIAGRGEEMLEISRKYIEGDDVTRDQRWFGILERAIALFDLDSLTSAEAELDMIYGELDAIEAAYVEVRLVYLEAQMDIMRGNPDAAIARLDERGIHWAMTMTAIHHMEILAEAHEAAGDLSSAVQVHKDLLRVFGGHALSHYELGKLYEQLERPDEAIEHYTRFLEMWENADEGLPQPEYAKQRLGALRGI